MPSNQQALSMLALFDAFTKERRYLHNVAAKTLGWYACSRKAFEPFLSSVRSEADLSVEIRKRVMDLAASGRLKPTSINDYVRCMNAFLRWLHTEKHVDSLVRVPKLKTQKKVLELLTEEQIMRVISYRPASPRFC